ncbi:MAG: MGDG synthase family glycosyltransferase [Deltaproteobacteria bacterium]
MNILFLSVSAGGGHMKAAEALKSYVEESYPGSKTLLLDTLKYINPIINKLVIGGYLSTVQITPKLYGILYDLAETGENISEVSQIMNRIISYKIKRLIRQFVPDIIVCTHPFTSQMVAKLKKEANIHPKIVTILTDFIPHPFWLHEGVDAYIVAHPAMKYEMISKGIKEETIFPFGIPISKKFLEPLNKTEVRNNLGLANKPTTLIMGGSLGFGDIKEVFTGLAESHRDLQLIVVAGQNKELYKKIRKYSNRVDKVIKVYGYTDKIPELMSASDLLISKPGGMTVSEALVKKLPMILISPIPGQEEKNARYLLNGGAAARLYPKQNVEEVLYQVLDMPARYNHMKEMCGYLAHPNSCQHIGELFQELIK